MIKKGQSIADRRSEKRIVIPGGRLESVLVQEKRNDNGMAPAYNDKKKYQFFNNCGHGIYKRYHMASGKDASRF